MSKTYNEEDFKNLIDTHTVQPPQEVWTRIEATMLKKKKRPVLLWFIYIGIGIGMLGIWLYKNHSNANIEIHPNIEYAKENVSVLYNEADEKMKEKISLASASSEQVQSTSLYPSSHQSNNLSNAINKKPSHYNVATNKIINQNNRYTLKEELPKPSEEIIPIQSTIINNAKHSTGENTQPLQNDAIEISFLPILKSRCESASVEKINKKISCPTFKSKKKIHFFLESSFSGGFHNQSLTTTENTKLTTLRNQTESEWYNWGLAVRGGVYLSPSLSIGTGFEYLQLKDRFNLSESKVIKLIVTYDTITGPPLDASLVRGTLVNKGENRYTLINIPLIIRYEKYMQSWKIGIDGGIIMNAHFANTGKMYNEKLNIEKFENNAAVFKTSLGLGYQLSAMLSKRLNIDTDIYIRPSYISFAKNWTVGGYSPVSSYTVVRCEIGVRRVM